ARTLLAHWFAQPERPCGHATWRGLQPGVVQNSSLSKLVRELNLAAHLGLTRPLSLARPRARRFDLASPRSMWISTTTLHRKKGTKRGLSEGRLQLILTIHE